MAAQQNQAHKKASLFIFPFFGSRQVENSKFTKFLDGDSLAWFLIQGEHE